MVNDYSADIEAPTDGQFAELYRLADQLRGADLEVEQQTESLKQAKERQRHIAEVALPELMDEMGMETFTTSSGLKATVKTSVHASIPKTRLAEAMTWLDKKGHGGMIKATVTVGFARDEQDEAKSLVNDLQEDGFAPKLAEGVHPSTLKAWAKKRLEAGEEIDIELFGVFRRREVKIDT